MLRNLRVSLLRARPLRPAAPPLARCFVQPRMSEIVNLEPLVSEKFKTALEAGDAFFFDSIVHVTGVQDGKDLPPLATVPWQIRTVPALLKKPSAEKSDTKDEKPKQNQRDVFAPPYVPNLLVKEFTDFTILVCGPNNTAE